MYYFYLERLMLPIAPSKLQITINNRNKAIDLINEGEVNIIKAPGLSTIKFDIMLPLITNYPFASYFDGKFKPAGYYLENLERLKVDRSSFQFIVSRQLYNPATSKEEIVMRTNMMVTLENYTITEDYANAPDVTVSIELKQYIKYGTVIKEIDKDTNTVKKSTLGGKSTGKKIPNTYTVKKGDTLWGIAKKLLGDGAKCWNLAKLNNISNPNRLQVGQVLKIQNVKATTAPASIKSKNSGSSGNNGKSPTAPTGHNAVPNPPTELPVKFSTIIDFNIQNQKTNPNPSGTRTGSTVIWENPQKKSRGIISGISSGIKVDKAKINSVR